MSINVGGGELKELKPRILVLGVGGAGGNAINAMIESGMEGVEFVAVNTDAQDLKMNNEENTNLERRPILGCNFKQNPKITKIIVAAIALAILIIGFSILALALRDENEKSSNGKNFLEFK